MEIRHVIIRKRVLRMYSSVYWSVHVDLKQDMIFRVSNEAGDKVAISVYSMDAKGEKARQVEIWLEPEEFEFVGEE